MNGIEARGILELGDLDLVDGDLGWAVARMVPISPTPICAHDITGSVSTAGLDRPLGTKQGFRTRAAVRGC